MNEPIPKGEVIEGDMSVALDSRFLNSIVLQGALAKRGGPSGPAEFLPVTIDRVEYHERLKYENGTTDKDAYLLYFVGSDKPLKLAKVNIRTICDVLKTTIGKGWQGRKIALGIQMDKRPDLGGKKGPCVRVLSIDPETGKPPPAW